MVTTTSHHSPAYGPVAPERLADWRAWRARRCPARRYWPDPFVVTSPAVTMRLSATRARFAVTPNSPANRTSWDTGSSGGSIPKRALARTERAVKGVLLCCAT
jgi:hypothetical protein